MKARKMLLLPTILAFAFPGVLRAQHSTDPVLGTWVLNVAKSKYTPGPAPQSETRTYEAAADGIHLTVHEVMADGTVLDETSTYKLDGKPYAFKGNPAIDAVAVTRVNDREDRADNLLNGKVVGRITRRVSKDGKILTFTTTGRTHDMRVYDRQ